MIELVVPGKARGKGRPRFDSRSRRTYTDAETKSAEQLIQAVWMDAGRPHLGDGPLTLNLEIVVARPKAHLRTDGSLSAAGIRAPQPLRRPDLDNCLKSCMDSVNGLAYKDDVQIVTATVWRRWASTGEQEHMKITIRALTVMAREAA